MANESLLQQKFKLLQEENARLQRNQYNNNMIDKMKSLQMQILEYEKDKKETSSLLNKIRQLQEENKKLISGASQDSLNEENISLRNEIVKLRIDISKLEKNSIEKNKLSKYKNKIKEYKFFLERKKLKNDYEQWKKRI